jgi:hypothetical protein
MRDLLRPVHRLGARRGDMFLDVGSPCHTTAITEFDEYHPCPLVMQELCRRQGGVNGLHVDACQPGGFAGIWGEIVNRWQDVKRHTNRGDGGMRKR